MGLNSFPGSCLGWGDIPWDLQALWQGYRWTPGGFMPRRTFQSPRLCGEPLLPHTSIWGAPKPAGSFGSVLVGPLLLSSHARGMENLVCALQVWNLFPSVCWKAYNQVRLAITTRFPGDSRSLCWIPRPEGLTWGSEPWQNFENFFGIIVLQSVGHSPGGYGIWFSCDCTPPPILLWLLLCLWTCNIFFWWVPMSSCQRFFNT